MRPRPANPIRSLAPLNRQVAVNGMHLNGHAARVREVVPNGHLVFHDSYLGEWGVQDAIADFMDGHPELQVVVDRERLAAYGLSILDVRNAIDRFNVSRSGGTITSGPNESIVRFDTRARSAADVLNYPITGVTSASTSATPPAAAQAASSGMGSMSGSTDASATGASYSAIRRPEGTLQSAFSEAASR